MVLAHEHRTSAAAADESNSGSREDLAADEAADERLAQFLTEAEEVGLSITAISSELEGERRVSMYEVKDAR